MNLNLQRLKSCNNCALTKSSEIHVVSPLLSSTKYFVSKRPFSFRVRILSNTLRIDLHISAGSSGLSLFKRVMCTIGCLLESGISNFTFSLRSITLHSIPTSEFILVYEIIDLCFYLSIKS